MYDKVLLGERIRKLRKKNRMNQPELCVLAKLGRPALSEIENGKRTTSLKNIVNISSVFGVSLDYLIFGGIEEGDLKNLLQNKRLNIFFKKYVNLNPHNKIFIDRYINFVSEKKKKKEEEVK